MNIGDRGLDLIRAFEGFRADPYLDAVGVPTIGYGSTYYPDGQRVRLTSPFSRTADEAPVFKRAVGA